MFGSPPKNAIKILALSGLGLGRLETPPNLSPQRMPVLSETPEDERSDVLRGYPGIWCIEPFKHTQNQFEKRIFWHLLYHLPSLWGSMFGSTISLAQPFGPEITQRLSIIDGGDGDVKPGGLQKAMVFSIPGRRKEVVFAASIHPWLLSC